MGKHYDQLDLDDRIEISRLHADGISRRAIGRMMGRSASTIGRELRRNSLPKAGYKPASADRIAWARRRRPSRIERLGPLGDHVRDHLARYSIGGLVAGAEPVPAQALGDAHIFLDGSTGGIPIGAST